MKPVLANGARLYLEAQALSALEDKTLTTEVRRVKLQALVNKIQSYGTSFDADIRAMMDKKVVAEAMRRLLSPKAG